METIQKESQKRGQLTDRIKAKSIELLGYEISQTELRLMTYAQYTLVNDQRLKPQHISEDEREVLSKWVNKGFVVEGISVRKGRPAMSEGVKFKVTKQFWDYMLEIIWLGYVELY